MECAQVSEAVAAKHHLCIVHQVCLALQDLNDRESVQNYLAAKGLTDDTSYPAALIEGVVNIVVAQLCILLSN